MTALRRLHLLLRRQPHADIAIAIVLWALVLLTTAAGPDGRPLTAGGIVVAGVACGAVALRRRWPFAVLLVSVAAAEAYLVGYQSHRGEIVLAAPLIAIYTVAETANRRRGLLIAGCAVALTGALHLLSTPYAAPGAENLALAALGAVAVAAGDAARNRRDYLTEAQARARHAEDDREAEAARRVTEERLRIARDLHDALGHHLALVNVQSSVALRVPGVGPAPVVEALDHIRSASRTALAELSDTVGLLRRPGDQPAPTEPLAGLSGMDELVAAFQRSGLTITTQVVGDQRTLPIVADLTGYRVLQESLTNAMKHAGPARVSVRIAYGHDSLRIAVENGGGGPAPAMVDGRGNGLRGMRERVAALGGTVEAGPRPDGGFRVSVALPLGAHDRAGWSAG